VGWNGELGAPGWRQIVASVTDLLGVQQSRLVAEAPRQSTKSTAPLLAVLAFDNLSGDADMAYFSDGVSEEIQQTIARSADLKVIGRSSSFQFRGAAKAVRHVRAELNVTHVLDGSVRRSGQRVRVSTQLIECTSETTLWSDRFDRDLVDVFALQDEIAGAVAAALKVAFAPSPPVGAIDPAAYDLYLRSRTSSPGLHGAFDAELLRQATSREPRFVQAWAALAITRALHALVDEKEAVEAARNEALRAAETALALDPANGTSYAALALLEPICGRFSECEALYEKALAASPNDPIVLEKFSRWLHCVGRSKEAFARIAQAFELDPLYHQGANWYAVMLAMYGRISEAFEVWDRARARWPKFDVLTYNPLLGAVAVRDWNRVDQLIEFAADLGLDGPLVREVVARAKEARNPTPQSSEERRDRLRTELRESTTGSLNRFVAAYQRGLHDEVFEAVNRASFAHLFQPGGRLVADDYGLHVLFNVEGNIRRDPRFVLLCAKLGLCEYWIKSGKWPDCVDEVANHYDFKAECERAAR
jgi:TolB-like protein